MNCIMRASELVEGIRRLLKISSYPYHVNFITYGEAVILHIKSFTLLLSRIRRHAKEGKEEKRGVLTEHLLTADPGFSHIADLQTLYR